MGIIEDFLKHHVEGYVFEDLENMAQLGSRASGCGAAAYPMVTTMSSAIELLGLLLATTDLTRWQSSYGRTHFCTYWKGCLYPSSPRSDVADPIYTVVRNGLAHTAITKGYNIAVEKADGHRHLSFDPVENHVVVDAMQLFRDLKTSYATEFTKKVSADHARIEARATTLLQEYEKTMNANRAQLTGLPTMLPPAVASAGMVGVTNTSVSTTQPLLPLSATFSPPKA